jgi:hypothetical protein
MAGDRTCIGPQCKKPAARGLLCWGHLKQRQRGQHELTPIEEPTPKELVLEAGNAWLEAEDDAEYRAAEAKFLRACEHLMLAQGWRPPLGPKALGSGRMVAAQLGLGFEVRARRRSGSR